jgi:toxin ParE1/3/4
MPILPDTLYIGQDSWTAADKVERSIYAGVGLLRDFPRMGRPGRAPNTRELVLAPLPYIVVYRVDEKAVQILRVLHGAQRWPAS